MSFDDWLLALHLLSAFALVGAMTLFTIVMVAVHGSDQPARVNALAGVVKTGAAVVGIGAAGTIIFGIWLALGVDVYSIWDGWVIAAIVLWAIGTETGRRSGGAIRPAFERAEGLAKEGRTGPDDELGRLTAFSRAWLLHGIASLAVILILIDMIWKPGA